MAQRMGFFEDLDPNIPREEGPFKEGPFVIVNATGWRIESELVGNKCPALPHLSIYPVKERLGLHGKTNDVKLAEQVCDKLNEMARSGEIVRCGNSWMTKEAADEHG